MSADVASTWLADLRLRNRIIEELESLTEPHERIVWGYSDYWEMFFDIAPYEGPAEPNSAMTSEESAAFASFLTIMQAGCAATPRNMPDASFMETKWPGHLASHAAAALEVFAKRGRLSEDVEEHR